MSPSATILKTSSFDILIHYAPKKKDLWKRDGLYKKYVQMLVHLQYILSIPTMQCRNYPLRYQGKLLS